MRNAAPIALLACALALAGCSATETGDPTDAPDSAGAVAEPTPTPTRTLPTPEAEPDQAGIAVFTGEPGSSMASTTGPALLGEAFTIEAACEGDSFAYRVLTADPSDSGRTLLTGTIDCADPASSFIASPGYRGPVQVSFVRTDSVTAAWVRVMNVDPPF
ncbi:MULTISPECIES: hypothetical protein [unclassified Microbacterium]|uniref:hypothetical protein n=1 Tax=unclassified Microbacterium TaxID=2609290 RepID=UPI003016F43C